MYELTFVVRTAPNVARLRRLRSEKYLVLLTGTSIISIRRLKKSEDTLLGPATPERVSSRGHVVSSGTRTKVENNRFAGLQQPGYAKPRSYVPSPRKVHVRAPYRGVIKSPDPYPSQVLLRSCSRTLRRSRTVFFLLRNNRSNYVAPRRDIRVDGTPAFSYRHFR